MIHLENLKSVDRIKVFHLKESCFINGKKFYNLCNIEKDIPCYNFRKGIQKNRNECKTCKGKK